MKICLLVGRVKVYAEYHHMWTDGMSVDATDKLQVPLAIHLDLMLSGSGVKVCLGGGFKYFLFSPLLGEDSQFVWYFSKGLKPPTSLCVKFILEKDDQKKIQLMVQKSGEKTTWKYF